MASYDRSSRVHVYHATICKIALWAQPCPLPALPCPDSQQIQALLALPLYSRAVWQTCLVIWNHTPLFQSWKYVVSGKLTLLMVVWEQHCARATRRFSARYPVLILLFHESIWKNLLRPASLYWSSYFPSPRNHEKLPCGNLVRNCIVVWRACWRESRNSTPTSSGRHY